MTTTSLRNSSTAESLYDDPPSRPGSPFEHEVVEAMEAFDEVKGDVVEI